MSKTRKPRAKKPRPFARIVSGRSVSGKYFRIVAGETHLFSTVLKYSATVYLERINAVAESWHTERCTACTAKRDAAIAELLGKGGG